MSQALLGTVDNVDCLELGNGVKMYAINSATTSGSATALPSGNLFVDKNAHVGIIVGGKLHHFRETSSSQPQAQPQAQPQRRPQPRRRF
jgi:hypothetical protein